tara:strand:- start:4041 stop:4472 length:432 start_codon:yes stop_codon:yes gene_type:complete
MSRIPAVKLQQLMGLDDYELTLAIDRVAAELGMTSAQVQAELDSVDSGAASGPIDSAIAPEVAKRTSIFKTKVEDHGEGAPTFVTDTSKFRISYDPSHEGKKRQKQVSQAIVCSNCSAPLGIPDIRPIKVVCPSCQMEMTYER